MSELASGTLYHFVATLHVPLAWFELKMPESCGIFDLSWAMLSVQARSFLSCHEQTWVNRLKGYRYGLARTSGFCPLNVIQGRVCLLFKFLMIFTAYSSYSTLQIVETSLSWRYIFSTRLEACRCEQCHSSWCYSYNVLWNLSGGHSYNLFIVKNPSNFAYIFQRQSDSCNSSDPNADKTPIL